MKLVRRLMLISTLLLVAGIASALPVTFTWESSTNAGAAFPSTQVFNPVFPFSGGGDIDEAAGTYDLNLPDFDVTINIAAFGVLDDAQIYTTGWGQVGTFTPGAGQLALTGTGASGEITCQPLAGAGGALVCSTIPLPPGPGDPVSPWPPTGGAPNPPWGPAGAWIDTADGPGYDGTIIVNEAYDVNGGQLQNIYRYSIIPEPGTLLLLGGGLAGIAVARRNRR